MKFEDAEAQLEMLRHGCANYITRLDRPDDPDRYDWYEDKYKRLTGTLMSLQTEYYDDE